MDFHGMKRKDLQALCKKHRIPANLKNIEMATRLASVFQKENEETFTDTKVLSDDDSDGVLKYDDDLVVVVKKKVRFSPEDEVFEFTRSVKGCQRKNVNRKRSKGIDDHVPDIGGIELKRSKRVLAKGKTAVGSNENEALKVPRPSKQIGSSVSIQETELMASEPSECEADISQGLFASDQDGFKLEKVGRRRSTRLPSEAAGTLLRAKRSKLVVVIKDELVKNNVKEVVSMDLEVQETGIRHRKDVQRRSRRFINDIDDQANTLEDQTRSKCSMNTASTDVEEKYKTMDEILICTPISELKEHSSVEAILEKSAECWKEIHLSKDDEKSSLEKEVQAANSHGNLFEYNTEDNSAEEETETTKVGCQGAVHCVNLTPEIFFDEYAELDPEEAGDPNVEAIGSSKTRKTVSQAANLHGSFSNYNTETSSIEEEMEISKVGCMSVGPCINLIPEEPLDKSAQLNPEEEGGPKVEGMSSSKKMKAVNEEHVMISENVLESTLKSSVDISPRGNTQELHSELMEGECEENHEQDTVLMAATKEKEESSSLSLFLIERSEVSNPEVEIFVETTPPRTSLLLAVSNREAELGNPTAHFLVKDIASTVIDTEDILNATPTFELKEHSFVAKLAEAEGILENSSECRGEVQPSKDGETGASEKRIQAESVHGNFAGYNTEMLDEAQDEILDNSEQRSSFVRGCKLKALELRRCSSTDFTSHSLEENNVSNCLKEDETKALSLPLPRNKDSSTAFDELAIFTTPERMLMLMEQNSEKGKTLAADSVAQHNDEAVESHAVVFTTPKQDLLLRDAGIVEAGKEEEHTTTDFPDETDVINSTERYLMLGGSKQTEARNEGESILVELHDESDIATSPEIKFSVGDKIGRSEENKTVALQLQSSTCTSLDDYTLLGHCVSDGAENSGGNKAMEYYEESLVFTGPETHEFFGSCGQDKAKESEGKKVVQLYEESLTYSELGKGTNSADKSSHFTSLEKQWLYGHSEQMKAVKTEENAAADESIVPNISERHPFPEDSELDEVATSEENKAVEFQVDRGIFTTAEKHLLLETDERIQGDDITTNFDVMSGFLAAVERQSLMGDSEPDEDEEKYRENNDVELLGKSNTSTDPERHILFGNFEVDETRKIRDYTAATCEDAFVFTSPERKQLLLNSESHIGGSQEQKEMDGSVVQESHVAAPHFRGNTIVDSSTSKVSYNHELNAGQDTAGAELLPKGSHAEDAVGLDATQGTSKKSREHSPHVDSVNLVDFDTEEAETIIEAERNVSFSSYVALQAKGNSETIDEIPSYLEVTRTCSMVSEESGPSTDNQNQIKDAVEELAITDIINEASELIETKNIQKGFGGNFLLNSTGGSYVNVIGKTCILAGTVDEDEAAGPVATTFEKTISLTPADFTVQNNMNEKDKEMIRREATTETRKEYLNINESGGLSEMQVRRETSLIYKTEVKPKRQDMKENAPNSKIVHNLNVTAPRTSKRQPLQDLRKN